MLYRLSRVAALIAIALGTLGAQSAGDALEQGFRNPPDSAKPRVWWHWMNGNITKEGIQQDLEWMKRVGIGGFQNFDAALSTPQIVKQRLAYMTPEWKDAFRYTTELADKLGLEMAIAASPGWSETGGPWVTPAQAMKKYVWSETLVEGGRPFTGKLAKPPATVGPLQNISRFGVVMGGSKVDQPNYGEYYSDVAVIGYRLPDAETPLSVLQPKVTSSGGNFDLAQLTDGDLVQASPLPKAAEGQKAWIRFEFAKPQTIYAVTIAVRGASRRNSTPEPDSGQELEASEDGVNFRAIAKVPGAGATVNTLAFSPVTARFFRMAFRPVGAKPSDSVDVAELALHTGAYVNRFEEKAAFARLPILYTVATPAVDEKAAIAKSSVIDLTSKMRADGTLDWTPPTGRWMVLRLGASLLGITNHPASKEATGLEVDKLDRAAVKDYMDKYLSMYKDTVGPLMGKRGLQYVIIDSWEAGTQNWTGAMMAEFSKRRGYSMTPWLPVLSGRVVDSAEASDRFLWDFRKTIGELTAEYHYNQVGDSLHERGMGRYTESHEGGRAFIGDGMDVKRAADVPMSAMWIGRGAQSSDEGAGYSADIRESASVAHIYGQNIAAAESLTTHASAGAWSWAPETLKPTADKELAAGLNRFVIHTSVHQPVTEKAPGLGLGPYGQWFTRLETWAECAKPWVSYLSRSSYMLQQGQFAADVAYFYGEDSNVTALFDSKGANVPEGYNYDFVNEHALLNRLSVKDGRIVTPTGMSYRVLALDPNSRYMTVAVLRKIRDMVKAGAVVVGPKPIMTPSLSDDPAEFQSIVKALWDGGKINGQRTLAEALNVPRDFEYAKPKPDTRLQFVHRRLKDGEIYWVSNRNDRAETVEATFRVAGKEAEIWHPVTGRIEPVSYRIAGGRTTVPLPLDPNDAVFVVFRKATSTLSRTLPQPVLKQVAAIEGSWDVAFQPNRGAPAKITLPKLSSWSESAEEGVKYFSGAATYTKTIEAPKAWFRPGARLWIDLGDVKNLAEVTVNGKSLGIVWKQPFRVDATEALKPGANQLQVKVVNLWVNRLIGDQQPNAAKKYGYTTQAFYQADSKLQPSGLLGPVAVVEFSSLR